MCFNGEDVTAVVALGTTQSYVEIAGLQLFFLFPKLVEPEGGEQLLELIDGLPLDVEARVLSPVRVVHDELRDASRNAADYKKNVSQVSVGADDSGSISPRKSKTQAAHLALQQV
jgi:hypothetical protein